MTNAQYVPYQEHRSRRNDPSASSSCALETFGSSEQRVDPSRPKLVVINLADFAAEALPQRQYVLAPILPERGLTMLYAPRGVGKTQVAFNIGWAVACGQPFLRWYAPKPRRVLYVDGEMPQELLQERAKAMIAPSACEPPASDFFRLLSMDRQELGVSLNLAVPDYQAVVEAHLEEVDLLILDNISTLVNSGRENDAESWNEMQAWLLGLRRMGKTVLLIHDSGRGGNARGTSKREDVLDTVIQLKHPDDYEPEDGARFEVNLTKARGIYGDDALPFEAKLDVTEPMGMETLIYFTLEGAQICGRVNPGAGARDGAPFRLAVDLNNMHLLNEVTGVVL